MFDESRPIKTKVLVNGHEGVFLQVAVGKVNVRVRPVEGGNSFLVRRLDVVKLGYFDRVVRPTSPADESSHRASFQGNEVCVLRRGRVRSRILPVGEAKVVSS